MCILFIAINQHKKYPLIIAANRDEFYQRPTEPSHYWTQHPTLLAGKDLKGHGTWMGITTSGKLSALTNIRAPDKEQTDAKTRGELVLNFLVGNQSIDRYFCTLAANRHEYNGYNLLFGDINNLHVFNNFTGEMTALKDGVYGLSNAQLNTPWPKLDKGKQALADYCQSQHPLEYEHLFELLRNDQPANDDVLPKTGISIEWERKLSSIFIQSPDYGTRSSTILLVDHQRNAYWQERTFGSDGHEAARVDYQFTLEQ